MALFSVPPKERAARRIGSVLAGKYEIERVIGAGGMATVYLAVHRNGRRVAVKLLHEELGIHSDLRARFVREGYVANAVGHPGAVLVYDDDEADDGAAFLVMELLTGETLSDRCKRRGGKLPCRESLALVHQLLDVLAAAHARGIVHRDIKPENLFLTTTGHLKVLDFGVARMRDGDSGSSLATLTGARIGTPAYMPPEQALGRMQEIDARTDLWAAGATLFSLLAGRTVHTADSAAELIVVAATTPPASLAESAPDIPAPVVAVVDRAVQFAREARFPDARSMQEALSAACVEAFGEPLDPMATGPRPLRQIEIIPAGADKETLSLPARARAQATTTPATLDAPAGAPGETETRPAKSSGRLADRPVLPVKTDPTLSSTLRTRLSRDPETASETPSRISPPAPRPWWPVAAALALAATIGSTYGVTRWLAKRESATSSPAPALSTPGSASARECRKNIDCKANGESICRKEDGACVPLATDLCKVLASPGDIENDDTVWIGAMYPVGSPDQSEYGPLARNAVELARRDFAEVSGGLPPAAPGGSKRPIGVVLCDDLVTPEPAADHLVRDLRVPAILGFGLSKEVMDLTTSHFLPNGVLVLASNTSSMLRDAPRTPGDPRLVFRVTSSSRSVAPPMVALLTGVIERDLRASLAMPPGEPMRVLMLRLTNLSGTTLSDELIDRLRFNGKTVAENGDRFRQLTVREQVGVEDRLDDATLAQLLSFEPHVILPAGPDLGVAVQIERAWPRTARFRPRYLHPSSGLTPLLVERLVADPSLRQRIYMVDGATTAEALAKFVHRYNEVYTPHITAPSATSAPYDAFYVFAYTAASLGAQPITGKALAAAIPRLLPPGEPIDVGPAGIYRAFHALAAGKNIDLQGAATTLDFDTETGDPPVDMACFCVAPKTPADPPRVVESGLVFRARDGELEGTMRCP